MRALRSAPLLLLAGLLAGCAEGPFVEVPVSQSVEKPVDTVKYSGTVDICYNRSTPWAEVEALAAESCAKEGYHATLVEKQPWQCRVTAPHRAHFVCSIPGMVDAQGRPINASDSKAIEAWRKRTGNAMPRPEIGAREPAAPAATPSAATPATPWPALTPADIAGKPAQPTAPPLVALPPAPPTVAPSGFTLEPGSWGQHFEE